MAQHVEKSAGDQTASDNMQAVAQAEKALAQAEEVVAQAEEVVAQTGEVVAQAEEAVAQAGGAANQAVEQNPMLQLIESIAEGLAADTEESSIINKLPDPVLLYILQFCDQDALMNGRRVCRKWFLLMRDMSVWRGRMFKPRHKSVDVRFRDEQLLNMLVYAPYITRLELMRVAYDGITFPGILRALKAMECSSDITRINLYEEICIEDPSFLEELALLCPLLENLCIRDDELLTYILPFKNLRELDIEDIRDNCFESAADQLVKVFDSCPRLDTLTVVWGICGRTIESIVNGCPGLKCLQLVFMSNNVYPDMSDLRKLTQLRSLRISSVHEVCPALLHALCQCTELRVLEFYSCNFVDLSPLKPLLKELNQLERLSLENTNVTDEILHVIATCKSLRTIYLAGCSEVTETGIWSIAVGLQGTLKQFFVCFKFQDLHAIFGDRFPELEFEVKYSWMNYNLTNINMSR